MATLAEIGESGWLERVRPLIANRPARDVVVGFGDDTAVIEFGGRLLLMTTDVLVEGTHFTWRTTTPAALGEKAIAVNVSDIASMGGRPVGATIGLGAPADCPVARLEAMFKAMARACRRWGAELVGGDTVRSPVLTIAVSLVGEFEGPRERLPLRSRLREGQYLYVTGTLGDSAAGLLLLLEKPDAARGSKARLDESARRYLIERHRCPTPRLAEGRLLADRLDDLAMIDLSDELWKSIDLLARAGGVGVEIRTDRLPISPALRRFGRALGRDVLGPVVFGGEDFELLFATSVEPRRVARLFREAGIETPVTMIGRAGGREVCLFDRRGREAKINWKPFEHFEEDNPVA